MQFPDESRNVSAYRKTNILPFIFLLIVVAVVASLVYFKSQGVDLKNISIKDFIGISRIFSGASTETMLYRSAEIKYSSKDQAAITAYNDFFVTCTRESIRFLDKSGNEKNTITVSMNSPILKTNKAWLLAVDIGGKEITLIDKGEIRWKGTAEGNIINAYVGANGDIAVVHESKGYKSALSVYDSKGLKKFSTQFAQRFLMSAVISESGKYILSSFLDASGINSNSVIEAVDMYGKSIGTKVVKENDIYIGAWYMQDDSYIAVSTNEVEGFDKEGNRKWTAAFEQGISSSVQCQDNYTAIASKTNGNGIIANSKSKVTVINNKGKADEIYQVEGEIRNLESYADIIAVNTGNAVYFINTKGKLLGKYDSDIEINSVCFFSKQEAAIISKNTAVVVNM